MVTVTQTASSDVTIYGTSPDRNWGAISYLTVASGGSGRRPYIYFNRSFPLGTKIETATLRLTQQRAADVSATRTLNAEPVAAAWLESKITWNNAPGVGALDAFADPVAGVGFEGRVIEFDVTEIMQAVADGAAWYGFRITSDDPNILPLYSRESGVGAPTLTVTWSDAPQQPARLSPAGGRAVSLARPTLSFDFTDRSGATGMVAYQVQLNDSADFTTPDTDTGEVAATVPLHTLTADVDVDEVVFWRARVKNTSGWSPWSDAASFTRKAKGTVTITNPAADPDNIVTEPTPPLSYTFSGTQTGNRVLVTSPTDPTVVLWDSGQRATTDQTVTPPSDLPLTDGQQYRVEVRVNDDVDREATPGDPIYAVAERLFTFELSSEVDPVSALSVAQDGERPWMVLSWSDSTAPDGLVVTRDGATVFVTADASDLLVSGTSYEFVDREADPQVEHEWSVQRIVNGVTSDDNPTATGSYVAYGAWVSTLDGAHYVNLAGEQGQVIRWDADEQVAVYRPYGASRVHLVTQSVFGRQGSADGYAKPLTGESTADVRAQIAAMRDREVYPYGTEMILTLVDTVTRIVWYGVVADERAEFGDEIGMRFTFNEVG